MAGTESQHEHKLHSGHPLLVRSTRQVDYKSDACMTTQEIPITPPNEPNDEQVLNQPDVSFAHWLAASPYHGPSHLLDLRTLDTPNRLLAVALTTLSPTTQRYAITPYTRAFDWSSLFMRLRDLVNVEGITWARQDFYVVEFRSKLKAGIDNGLLFKLDKESHAEAAQSGGLLKYWFGDLDGERRNLATCLWRSKADAITGGKGPWHKQARAATAKMYEEIDVKGLRLTIGDNVESWEFASYA